MQKLYPLLGWLLIFPLVFWSGESIAAGHTVTVSIVSGITCNGACDGAVQATISGGVGPFVITWSNGGMGTTLSNLCAGQYLVTVLDQFDNSTAHGVVNVNQPEELFVHIINQQHITCHGSCTGAAIAGASGGTPPYTYNWSNGVSGTIVNNLCAITTYTVTLTDANGCAKETSVNLNQPPPITGGITKISNMECHDICSGELLAGISGGTPPHSYLWSVGSTNQTLTNLCKGTYTVTMQDSKGCSIIDSATILKPSPIALKDTLTTESCPGCCDAQIELTVSGGEPPYSYSWNDSNQSSTADIHNLCAGTYKVIVTDDYNCSVVDFIVVSQCYTLQGTVYANSVPANNVWVYLIQEYNDKLSVVDSQNVTGGTYSFSNVCSGAYLIKAVPTAQSGYIPTYYNSDPVWSMATALLISYNSTNNDIDLIPQSTAVGSGSISGQVRYEINPSTGELGGGVRNTPILALDESGGVHARVITDTAGRYSFTALQEGSYKIFPDLLNRVTVPHEVGIDQSQLNIEEVNFKVTVQNQIIPIAPVGVQEVEKLMKVEFYPNPVDNELNLLVDRQSTQLNVTIEDIAGRVVSRHQLMHAGGGQAHQISTEKLNTGTYIVTVSATDQIDFKFKLIKNKP